MAVYRVVVGGKEYQVEVEDVNARPVRTVVNGQVVQVWVQEQGAAPSPTPEQPTSVAVRSVPTVVAPASAAAQPGPAPEREVRAPMPGSIVSVAVQPGERVEVGQDLVVLDAMKMNTASARRARGPSPRSTSALASRSSTAIL